MHFLKVNNPMMADRFAFNVDLRTFKNVSINYERFKEYAHVIDFSDMLVNFIQNRKALPVDVAIIDEAQDLTSLQWRMCEIAFAKCKKIYIAGDDDQAIYEWNGADVDYFLNLKGHRIILNKSYRLRKNILSFAKLISREIKHRVDKQFLPLNHEYNG
jgi:DNA helicase-2/ATP-dependent DNA helicase PcrA